MPVNSARQAIEQNLDWLDRQRETAEGRYARASNEGGLLAAAVAAYLEDPADYGLHSLREAYGRFMTQHSGNFFSGNFFSEEMPSVT